jgi:hypothetical protein
MPLDLLRHGPTGSVAQTKFPQTPDRNTTWAGRCCETAGTTHARIAHVLEQRTSARRSAATKVDGWSERASGLSRRQRRQGRQEHPLIHVRPCGCGRYDCMPICSRRRNLAACCQDLPPPPVHLTTLVSSVVCVVWGGDGAAS